MKQEHEMTPGVLVSGEVLSAGDARARVAVLEAELAQKSLLIREMDLMFGRMLLGMRAAVIEEEHGKGAEEAMVWIFNGLVGPGELPPEEETDAQAYFDREVKAIDEGMKQIMEERKALGAAPAPVEQEGQEPAAWIRFRSDGCYEGPHRSIDDVRKRSGKWTPLYPASAPVEPSAVKDSLTAQPAAYAVFAENGNIRIWCADPVQAETLRAEYGRDLQPLYTAPQPAPTACTGKNCGSTDPNLHSADCFAEHEKAIAPTAAQDVVGVIPRPIIDWAETGAQDYRDSWSTRINGHTVGLHSDEERARNHAWALEAYLGMHKIIAAHQQREGE